MKEPSDVCSVLSISLLPISNTSMFRPGSFSGVVSGCEPLHILLPAITAETIGFRLLACGRCMVRFVTVGSWGRRESRCCLPPAPARSPPTRLGAPSGGAGPGCAR